MANGSLFSGFAQGFAQARERKLQRAEDEEVKKLKLKLFKNKLEEQEATKAKLGEFMSLLKGTPGTPEIPREGPMPSGEALAPVPAQQAVPGKKLIDLLSTPQGQALALSSGMFSGKDLAEISRKKEPFGGALGGADPKFQLEGMTVTDTGKRRLKFGLKEDVTPLSSKDTLRFINKEGKHPKAGVTPKQALDQGFIEASTAEQSLALAQRGPKAIIKQLRGFLDLFPEKGLAARGKAAVSLQKELITQDDPRVAQFESISKGSTALLVRALGEKGTLNEGDIERAQLLQPKISGRFGLPDTREVAEGKIARIEKILTMIQTGEAGSLEEAIGITGGIEKLPAGVPAGSRQIGTSGGNPVYETPDGQRVIVE